MSTFLWSRAEGATDWSSLELISDQSTALSRLWRGFKAARYFVAAMLLLLQALAMALGQPMQVWALAVSGLYLVITVVSARYARFQPPIRRFGPTWMATMGLDLLTFTALQLLQVSSINYTPLFALPVLMGAVLGTAVVNLGTTAAATLLLLAHAAYFALVQPADASSRFVQAALTGTGLFVVALLAHELAKRLTREEALAQRNRSTAQMHALVNDMVIETLTEGVLVIDARGMVHAANPAADAMLGHGLAGLDLPFALNAQPAWRTLASVAQATFSRRQPQTREVPIAQQRGVPREVRARTQLTPSFEGRSESLCVMYLQDLREIEARIRTEKLAAMGRMSAAVAHEIRNPLAAITQASALLAEDLVDPAQRQLTQMVQHNALRLSRIVDDVLDVARVREQRVLPLGERLALDATVRSLSEEWVRQTRRQGVLLALGAEGVDVEFDVEHLRRILVNLLDNASRYAGERDGSIQIFTRAEPGSRPGLLVWSDGAPLEPAVQRHLFEPFFSSESRSSGLGLFLCRELCERHGAFIGYERAPLPSGGPEGNGFFIAFAAGAPRAEPQ